MREGPARQAFARIPFALAVMQHRAGRKARRRRRISVSAKARLVGTDGRGVPFRAIHVVDRDEGRLAAHREAHIAAATMSLDVVAERLDRAPLLVACTAWLRAAARGCASIVISNSNATSHSSTAPLIGAADEGLAVQASGICPSPANRPEVGSSPTQPAPGRYTSHQACRSVKSCLGARGPVERLHIGLQLDQVAGSEARGEAKMAQELHQQPRRVAARARAPSTTSLPASGCRAPCGSRYLTSLLQPRH